MHWKAIGLAIGLAICTGALAPAEAVALPTGSISGTVTDAGSHAPIVGDKVCAISLPNGMPAPCAEAGAAGEYTISGLAAGQYAVNFEAYACPEGSCGPIDYIQQYYNGKATFPEADPVSVSTGATEHVDAALQRGATITGTARDASSQAGINNLEVCALAADSGESETCARTNAGGEYALVGLRSGAYKVTFYVPFGCTAACNYLEQLYQGAATFGEATLVGATAGQATTGIDASMQPAGEISGTVTKIGGTPIANVEVCAAQSGNGEAGECAATDAAGEYTIAGLPSGAYAVSFLPPFGTNLLGTEVQSVSVAVGHVTPSIDAKLATGGEISGKVSAAKAPAEGALACALEGSPSGFSLCATTNSGGEYTIQGLTSGSHKVVFIPPGYPNSTYAYEFYPGKSTVAEAEPVTVAAGGTTENINIELPVGSKITGTISFGGAPLSGGSVCLYPPGSGFGSVCTSSSSGEYTLYGLPGGSYELVFSGPFECTWYDCGSSNYARQRTNVPVAASTTAKHNAELQAGGVITGTVRDANDHKAVPRGEVCAVEAGGLEEGQCSSFQEGVYRVAGLATGSYKLALYPFPINYATQYYSGQSSLQTTTPVSVQAGQTREGIDFSAPELFPAAPVSTSAPALGGTAIVGHTLSCSQGGWAAARVTIYSYAWLRDGSAIAGQAGATYTLQAADAGHAIACSVTATNLAGTASATSNALSALRSPSPRPLPHGIAIAKRIAIVKGGKALVVLNCTGAGPCEGALRLVARVVRRHVVRRHGKRHVVRTVRHVVIGQASFSIALGKSATVKVPLTVTGRSLVARAGKRGVSVSIGGRTVKAGTVKLEPAKVHRHRRKRRH